MSKKYLYISLFVVLFLNIRVWGQPGCVNVTITTNGGNDFTLPCNQPCTNIDAVAVQTSGETSNIVFPRFLMRLRILIILETRFWSTLTTAGAV